MRTAIFVELEEDEPRQLENILRSFGKRKINLTDINRLRYRNHNVFHVECEGQEDSPAVAEALDEIKDSRWGIMKIAGSYPFKKFRNPNNQNNSK